MTYPPQPGNWPEPSWPAEQPYQGYGYSAPPVVVAAPATNGLAIAALVCALAGIATCGVTSVIGAILGHVARRQIRERGESGDGLALAGIITGWIIFGLYALFWLVYIVFFVVLVSTAQSVPNPQPFPT
jgi:hypothetical protein